MDNEVLSDNLSLEEHGEEILILSIDIGDGRKDQIKIHEKDNSDQLALEFCSKHRLGPRTKIILAEEIDKNKIALLHRSNSFNALSNCEGSTNATRPASAIQEATEKKLKQNNKKFKDCQKSTKTMSVKEKKYDSHKNSSIEKTEPKKPRVLWKNSSGERIKQRKLAHTQINNEETSFHNFSNIKPMPDKESVHKK